MPLHPRLLSRTLSTATQMTTVTAAKTSPSKAIYKERNLKRLVEKFKKFSENDRFRTKTSVYEETIRRLAVAKRYNWIEEILEDQKKYKDIQKEGYNTRLIRLYGESNMFDNARKMFDEMPERNCKRTVQSFNALLAACVDSKKFDDVDGLFRELPKELEIKPNTVSYNTLIKAYCEMGSLDKAKSLLVEMEMEENKPDLITFNILLNGFYSNGLLVNGDEIWSQMVQKIFDPDTRSYNAKLLGLAMNRRTKDAVFLLEEMKNMGIKPDVYSFNSLISGFVKEENLDEAKHWYYEMRDTSDCRPNKFTFTRLIPFVCEKGDLGFALELSKDVINKKRVVDMALLQQVVDVLVMESKIDEAEVLVKIGMDNGYCRYKLKISSED